MLSLTGEAVRQQLLQLQREGWVDSRINARSPDFATERLRAAARASVPLEHRPTEPREIGEAVAYFAAPGAAHTTGAFLRVDGGAMIGKY